MSISEEDLKRLLKAHGFAAHKHRDQRRKDVESSPYINHLIALANNLCNEGHAAYISDQVKLIKLADKISNLRDVASNPPTDWDLQRRRDYFDWAMAVIDRLRGVHGPMGTIFDEAYAKRP